MPEASSFGTFRSSRSRRRSIDKVLSRFRKSRQIIVDTWLKTAVGIALVDLFTCRY